MSSEFCRHCRRVWVPQPLDLCGDCRRHQAIGVVVLAVLELRASNPLAFLTALESVSELLGVVTALRRQHNREIFEEQRGAQRDARAAYDEGRLEGTRERGDSW